MIKVSPINDKTQKDFEWLFRDYYKELGVNENCTLLFKDYIIPDVLAGLTRIDVLEEDKPCGFVMYQIDEINNDWNFKEGWGDIREIYVAPSYRRRGYGKFLLYTAEMKLKEAGATQSYCLPEEGAIPFFTACGYKKTDEYNEDVDCAVYVKENINNTCKHNA